MVSLFFVYLVGKSDILLYGCTAVMLIALYF